MTLAKVFLTITLVLSLGATAYSQSSQDGTILKWDTEAYAKHGNVTRNAVVYYIQIANTIYQVTRGTTKPESYLASGMKIRCRIEKNQMYIAAGQEKEGKFSIIGSSVAP